MSEQIEQEMKNQEKEINAKAMKLTKDFLANNTDESLTQ